MAILLSLIASKASASDPLNRWPIPATIVRVIDGDTVVVDAHIWPQMVAAGVSIRVLGIDTPERRGKCALEKQRAEQAKAIMAEAFPVGDPVLLVGVKPDKFGGRFNARVLTAGGKDWGDLIQAEGLAAPYTGQGPKRDWCADTLPDPPN